MKKAEGEALRRTISKLEAHNRELEQKLFYSEQTRAQLHPALCKARALLGMWMQQRFDRERYPVATTRTFLKAWWS